MWVTSPVTNKIRKIIVDTPNGALLGKNNCKNLDISYRHIYLGHPLKLKGVWAYFILDDFIIVTPTSISHPSMLKLDTKSSSSYSKWNHWNGSINDIATMRGCELMSTLASLRWVIVRWNRAKLGTDCHGELEREQIVELKLFLSVEFTFYIHSPRC